MMKISVCIATYNGEKFIKKQLQSILRQLSEDDEIIISDDNSMDDTLLIVHQMNDVRIKVYSNKGHSGPVHNFEQALNKVTGSYILLADQDDIWEEGKVKVMRSLLAEYDLVLSDCEVVDESERVIYTSFFSHRGSRPGFWRNIYKNSYVGCCMAFRAEVLAYALPFPSHIHMHDWWIGLLAELKGKVYFYPHSLMKYVRHGQNASPTGDRKKGYDFLNQFKNRAILFLKILVRVSTLRT